MSRPLWFVQLLKIAYPGRFLAARSTRIPLFGDLIDRFFFGGDDLLYLPQDQVIPVNQPLDLPQETVLPSQVVEHFIEQASVHWIMDACICRQSENCQDYPIDLGCLFLGEAALDINPELGRRVTKEEALEHVRRCREAGLVHLIGRNKLDTIWMGVGPGERLLTICNCCPCCCLWGTLPHLAPKISSKVNSMPGVTVTVNGRCTGCGVCTQGVCFVDNLHLQDGHVVMGDECRGCGRCVAVCPQQAIELSIARSEFVDDSIARLSAVVDVS